MDKITQVIEMMEHPERYSETQITELLQDEECLQTYLTMMEMRKAFDKEATDKMMDIDSEWQKFTAKHHQVNMTFAWRKVAAAFVGLVMLSGIAFAAIHSLSSHRQPENVSSADTVKVHVVAKDTAASLSSKPVAPIAKKEIIHKTFDNVTMEKMFGEIARYYGVRVIFRNEEAKRLRFYYEWNSESNLQQVVDELNNSQQMNISLNNDELVIE